MGSNSISCQLVEIGKKFSGGKLEIQNIETGHVSVDYYLDSLAVSESYNPS
jgi:hypothetical protein